MYFINCILYSVTEVNDHENYAETPDEFPYETIDLSSPEFQNELEINVCNIVILIVFVFFAYIFKLMYTN